MQPYHAFWDFLDDTAILKLVDTNGHTRLVTRVLGVEDAVHAMGSQWQDAVEADARDRLKQYSKPREAMALST